MEFSSIIRIGSIAFVLTMLVIWLVRFEAKRKRVKEEKFQAARKMQESSLKEALSNSMERKEEIVPSSPYRPYKVEYTTGERQNTKEKRPLLQLIEKNKLAEKKYIFRSNETVFLGVQFGTVGILNHLENTEPWCELFFQNGDYCVRSCENGAVYLRRRQETAIVDRMGIKLKSGDIILLQETAFHVSYIKG